MCKTLYHYCTIDKFCAMMQNGTLRFSDITQSNDSEELKFIIHVYQKYVKEKNKSRDGTELFLHSIDWFVDEVLKEKTAYAICFSEGKDLLSQWRGYAKSNGLAIGFKKDKLFEYVQKICISCGEKAKLVKIKYVPKKKVKKADNGLADELNKNYVELQNIFKKQFKKFFSVNDLHLLLPLSNEYKNGGFFEEKEWRIVFNQFYRANDFGQALPPVCFQKNKIDVQFSSCRSYYDLPFPYEAIDKIIIGPNNQIEKSAIYACLENSLQKHSTVKRSKNVNIEYTELTYHSRE